MKLMALDLEMNQPSGKIIQIGACVLDHRNEKIIATFNLYVNPKENLTPEIIELTGITQEKVDTEGYDIKDAYEKLKEFHKKNKCFKNPILWGSGSWSDSDCLYKQSKSIEPNFMGHRVIDTKTIYQSMMIRQGKTTKSGLVASMEKMGLGFDGRPHDALADAINTARFWLFLTKVFKS